LDLRNGRGVVVPRARRPGRPDLYHLVQRFPTVYADDRTRILENPAALPRAWIVHQAREADDNESIYTKFALRLADPTKTVYLTDGALKLDKPADPGAESVVITSYGPDEIHLRVDASATGMVVLSEIWDPGWRATVNGKATEILKADGLFRGIVVEPGSHEVVLTYPAERIKRELLLYLVPLVGLLAVPILGRRDPAVPQS
jgi:hypothetical protein